ncbi:MAG: hypothetical protein JRI66_10705 [Deltaproteobacteria bacterium]|nr:hypothetical protein [Deltaproteobacteria bacterium]
MFTSTFWRFYHRQSDRLVSISIKSPEWFKGRHYRPLNPPPDMLHCDVSDEEWARKYRERVLERLNPQQVYEELGPDAILLCWEPPGVFCHRRLVAEWLEENLGIEVPELPANYHPKQKTFFEFEED